MASPVTTPKTQLKGLLSSMYEAVSFPENLAKQVKGVAREEDRNISELFREAFRSYKADRIENDWCLLATPLSLPHLVDSPKTMSKNLWTMLGARGAGEGEVTVVLDSGVRISAFRFGTFRLSPL
jgi:hypothetical protein